MGGVSDDPGGARDAPTEDDGIASFLIHCGISNSGCVVDYGCGYGRWVRPLGRLCERVIAVDRDETAIRHVESMAGASNVKAICSDSLSVVHEPVDAIISI